MLIRTCKPLPWREAKKEIALDRNNVEVLGTFPRIETVTGFSS